MYCDLRLKGSQHAGRLNVVTAVGFLSSWFLQRRSSVTWSIVSKLYRVCAAVLHRKIGGQIRSCVRNSRR